MSGGGLPARVAALAVGIAVAVLLAEAVIRISNVDERYLARYVYRAASDVECHEPVDDPELIFRLKPGLHATGGYPISINRHRARGPERDAVRPLGTLRVVTVGGSNVYGADVRDDETWPARLEGALRARGVAAEVWNFGTSAYVPTQDVAIAREGVATLDPDIILMTLSNTGAPAFLQGAPVGPLVSRHPQLWFDLVVHDRFASWPPGPHSWHLGLVAHSRLWRFAMLAMGDLAGDRQKAIKDPIWERRNVESFRRFVAEPQRARVAVLLTPAIDPRMYDAYTHLIDVPVFHLRAEGLPPEYREIHPPAHVLAWYGERIAERLIGAGMAEVSKEVNGAK
ncbi:MAG: hypothetical protein IT350_00225 [Deltaproteobacteria bacterium]|nr:hypothetical protein [Deltaproteobacteria bacterium]